MPTYRASADVRVGQRVRVNVARGSYVGVVRRIGVVPEVDPARILPVGSVESGLPDISLREIELWEFIASYYLCTIGEVYKAAYPSLKVRSEETAANAAAAKEERRIASAARMLESVKRRIARLEASLAAREKALEGRHKESVASRLEFERDRIAAELEAARESLEGLSVIEPAASLVPARRMAQTIAGSSPKPVLLRGSRRVPEYVRMVRETLAEGRDALILVPDIVFCDRLEKALAPEFPELLVFNSQHTQARRRRIASSLRNSESPCVVLGTRSAVFLPFCDLGLVIVDEEQDMYYKQTEPAPRYNGRDVAIKLAAIHGARTVLGSSLPSLESEYNCISGKYLSETLDSPEPASVMIVDIPAEKRKRGMLGELSRILLKEIAEFDGSVTVIRTWEKEDAVREQLEKYLPGREIGVMTMAEARRDGFGDFVAILQADALTDRNDFRADERAAQLVAQLRSMTRVLLIQTSVPARWNGSRGATDLLSERREFSFPPFTRLVTVSSPDGPRQFFLPRDRSLASRKAEIASSALRDEIIDVDPV